MFRLFRNFTLQIEPTNACNLDCKICLRRNIKRPISFLSLHDFKKILDSGNFRYVGLHGWGEPMLNQQLFEMIKYAESKGVSTNTTSSGTLIRKNMDNIFSSGLKEIAFGVYDKRFLSRVLPQIEGFLWEKRRRGSKIPKTYLDITIYKDNFTQILDVIRLASELQIDAVILHRLFNLHKVALGIECLSKEEEKKLFIEVKLLARKLRMELYLPPKHTLPCRVVKRSIFVTVEGKVTPCCYLPEFVLGDALNDSLGEIIHSKAYNDFIRNMRNHPICSKCLW